MNYRQYRGGITQAAASATLLVFLILPGFAQGTRNVTLTAGTVIPVKLQDKLSSTDSQKGDRFTATLQSEDAARSLNLPVGTMIEGTVSAVRSMQGQDPGILALSFNRMILPNESSYPIHGSLIGLDSKSVTRDRDGRLMAKSDHKNKTLLYAGYGAGAGLILGTITKGNTLLDTLLGGGLGYLFGSLDQSRGERKDVVLRPNTEMGVRLDRTVNLTTYDDGSGYDNSNSPFYHRTQTDRYGNRIDSGNDTNRDPYDDTSVDYQNRDNLGTYDVLNRYTNIEDNGEPISIFVNRRQMSFLSSARPFISNGVVMVPAIAILRAEHARYNYTSTQFTAFGPGEPLTGRFGSRIITGSGTHRFTLPAPIQRRNGTVFVPMQFLAIVTGQGLNFDPESRTMELGGSSKYVSPRP